MSKYNILIVEDHALTRFGLRTVFDMQNSENFFEVGTVFEAPNARKGIELVENEKIDIILMDLGLPDMSGIEAIQIIKQKYPSMKIIVLSSHEKEEDVIKAIRAGANAYCTKDVDQDKLVYIVSTVLKGAAWFDPKVAQYVLNAATNDATVSTQKVEIKQDETAQNDFGLTSREKQVLGYLSEGASNQEISKKLNLSVNTIKVHVCNILHKMSVSDRTQAAIKAIKHNII